MNNEYVIINKTEVLKEIESLKESLDVSEKMGDSIRAGIETFEIKRLEWCLFRSTPLIPEIEKAYDAGNWGAYSTGEEVHSAEGYFFTPEQLNEYTANVIKQALETAAENAEIEQKGYFEATPEECLKGVEIYYDNGSDRPSFIAFVNKQSITNTFEETYNKLKV